MAPDKETARRERSADVDCFEYRFGRPFSPSSVPSYSPSTRSHPQPRTKPRLGVSFPPSLPLVNSTTAFFKKSLSWDDFDFIQKPPTYRAPAGVAEDGAAGARKTLERFWLNASEYALRKERRQSHGSHAS